MNKTKPPGCREAFLLNGCEIPVFFVGEKGTKPPPCGNIYILPKDRKDNSDDNSGNGADSILPDQST